MMAIAVSTLSVSLLGLLAETLTTWGVTAIGPLLTGLGPAETKAPGDSETEAPGDGDPLPAPGVVAFPLTTTQFSGAPSLSHGEGCGASSSSVSLPLVKVGLLQPASVVRFGPGMAPGIFEL